MDLIRTVSTVQQGNHSMDNCDASQSNPSTTQQNPQQQQHHQHRRLLSNTTQQGTATTTTTTKNNPKTVGTSFAAPSARSSDQARTTMDRDDVVPQQEQVAVIPAAVGEDTSSWRNTAPTTTSATTTSPAEIPPEPTTSNNDDDNITSNVNDPATNPASHSDPEDDEDEEDDYEYEDDDDAPFAGFLIQNHAALTTSQPAAAAAPATIEEESVHGTAAAASSSSLSAESSAAAAAAAVDCPDSSRAEPEQRKWRQPTQEAVNMSLRAQKETSGGKRRLAQDLFRIMNQDTAEAGFSLQPAHPDRMDQWTIKLFQFDPDSNLAKDMLVLSVKSIDLEMSFPDQYPFEPPFVRVVRPRFKRQTGFVMSGALCMELLTKDGWNPINDIESVIVSIRSLLVVGDGRLEAASNLPDAKYQALLQYAQQQQLEEAAEEQDDQGQSLAVASTNEAAAVAASVRLDDGQVNEAPARKRLKTETEELRRHIRDQGGSYSTQEAKSAYTHLSDYHKKKGWDTSGWWERKG